MQEIQRSNMSIRVKTFRLLPHSQVCILAVSWSLLPRERTNMLSSYFLGGYVCHWSLVILVPFAASFLAESMVQSSHPPLVAKIQAKIYSGTNNASES